MRETGNQRQRVRTTMIDKLRKPIKERDYFLLKSLNCLTNMLQRRTCYLLHKYQEQSPSVLQMSQRYF